MKEASRRSVLRKTFFSCSLAVLLLFGVPASGDQDAAHVRELRAAGTILSLEYFISDARTLHLGRMIDAKLHYEASHGLYVYEILILDRWGQVWELEYDACSGVLIEREKLRD